MLYYKIEKSSTLGQDLSALLGEMKRCNKEALALMNEVGAKGIFRSNFSKAGGIHSFSFSNHPGSNWKKKDDGCFYPNKSLAAMRDLVRKIEALPWVSVIDWANTFKTDLSNQPGLFADDQFFWVESNLKLDLPDAVQVKLSEWALAKEKKEGVV